MFLRDDDDNNDDDLVITVARLFQTSLKYVEICVQHQFKLTSMKKNQIIKLNTMSLYWSEYFFKLSLIVNLFL